MGEQGLPHHAHPEYIIMASPNHGVPHLDRLSATRIAETRWGIYEATFVKWPVQGN